MIRKFILLLCLSLGVSTLSAQHGHYYQHELFYSPDATSEADYDAVIGLSGPSNPRHTNKHFMRKSVYGFHPGWSGTAWESYDYGLLPMVAYYGYMVDPANGSYKSVYFWKTTRMIQRAHEKGSAVELAVATGSKAANRQLLKNPRSVTTLVDSVVALVKLRNGDGVCLDFEGLPGDQRDTFTGLVRQLKDSLAKHLPKAGITLCLPGRDEEKAYDIDSLRSMVNQFVVKPYDWKSGLIAGPVAPLRSGSFWGENSIDASISHWLKAGVPREDMILSVPNFSWKWNLRPTTSSEKSLMGPPELITYSELKRKYNYPVEMDSLAQENWAGFHDDDGSYEIKISDGTSIQPRYDLVYDRNLGGVAIWALGYDNGFDGLWDILKSSFSQSVKDEVEGFVVDQRNELLLGPDNGETMERNRNNWIPMLVGCIFLIIVLFIVKRVM